MKRVLGVFFVLLGLAISVGIGVYVYIEADRISKLSKQVTAAVVVAQEDLPARSAIEPSEVAVVQMQAELIPPDAATSPETVVGRYPLSKIFKGQPVIQSSLADTSGQTGPAFMLKDDSVAVTYPGSDLLSMAGAVRAGDRVDLLVSLPVTVTHPGASPTATAAASDSSIPIVSQIMLQNIEVLQVGGFNPVGQPQTGVPGQPAQAGKYITFQVKPQDALVLKWAKDSGATLDLALRPPTHKEEDQLEAVNSTYISKRFRINLTEQR